MRNLRYFIVLLLLELVMSTVAHAQDMSLTSQLPAKISLPLQLHLQYIFSVSSLILSLICFVLARSLRSCNMAILALFFTLKSLGVMVGDEFSVLMFFASTAELSKVESLLFILLSNLALFAFTAKLFALKKRHEKIYNILLYMSFVMIVSVSSIYVIDIVDVVFLIQLQTSLALITLYSITKNVAKKTSENRLLLMFLLVVTLQFGFNFLGYLFNYLHYTSQAINQLDMLSFGVMAIMMLNLMGRKYYYHLENEKLVQQQALDSARASDLAQQNLMLLQEDSQEQLESRVQERTLELNIALQELEAVNRELEEINTLDELSGLYNRRFYDQKILAEFRRSRRNLAPLSLILVDIDHFKAVNDTYGHLMGDKCIVEVANMIKSLLRRSADVGCRYGGEEFCLILPETDNKGALALAQDICQSIRQHNIYDEEHIIALTVSCGVTTYQQEKDVTPDIIFASADKALYSAKQAGRDQVHVA